MQTPVLLSSPDIRLAYAVISELRRTGIPLKDPTPFERELALGLDRVITALLVAQEPAPARICLVMEPDHAVDVAGVVDTAATELTTRAAAATAPSDRALMKSRAAVLSNVAVTLRSLLVRSSLSTLVTPAEKSSERARVMSEVRALRSARGEEFEGARSTDTGRKVDL